MALKKLEWWDRFKVSDESTDIRGWKLNDRRGHCMGEIEDLIFDPEASRVRYAVADIGNRKVLVPVGLLHLDEDRRQAVASELTTEDIERLEGYTGRSDLDDVAERRHYRDFHPEASESERPSYRGARFETSHPRLRRIEERLRQHSTAREATFAASEPTPEELRNPAHGAQPRDIEQP